MRHAQRILQERAAQQSLAVDELFAGLNAALTDAKLPLGNRLRKVLGYARGIWPRSRPSRNHDGRRDIRQCRCDLLHDPAMELGEPGRAWVPTLAAGFARMHLTSSSPAICRSLLLPTSPPPFVWASPRACRRLPLASRWAILEALTSHAEDAADHNLPLMYWYAMEPLAEVDPPRALALALSAGEKIPILKEFMIRRIGAGDPAEVAGAARRRPQESQGRRHAAHVPPRHERIAQGPPRSQDARRLAATFQRR